MKPTNTWQDRLDEIALRIKRDPLDSFLQWSVIHATMFVADAPYIRSVELPYLQSLDWQRWRKVIRDPGVGSSPRLVVDGIETSGNLIHQAYHLAVWEVMTKKSIAEIGSILEFGGGYGAMARVAIAAGFAGKYSIVDLAPMHDLQRYYLAGAEGNIEYISDVAACDLFIACWSLSELADSDDMQSVLAAAKAKSHLVAYCPAPDIDAALEAFRKSHKRAKCQIFEIEHLAPNSYMLGPITA